MNRKSVEARAFILRCLVEGNSIRSTVRITRASKNTIAKVLTDVGEACMDYHDRNMVNLPCKRIQVDEVWSFVYAKERNVPEGKEGAGTVWIWIALCPDTKIVPSFYHGDRGYETAGLFMDDLAKRIPHRFQLSSDGHRSYPPAVWRAFKSHIDYGIIDKQYGTSENGRRNICIGIESEIVSGNPDPVHVSTSLIERQNLTLRMCMRRLTRKTNAHSKKMENHILATALHFGYYNFCRKHETIKTTPAVAAGIADKSMTLEDLVLMSDEYWEKKLEKPNPVGIINLEL